MPTVDAIAQNVILELGSTPGTNVQTYMEDRVKQRVIRRFQMLFRELWWPDLTIWVERTLDGTMGVITQSLPNVESIVDVMVFDKYGSQLTMLPKTGNPFRITGTKPLYISSNEDYENYLLQFWPKTATGTLAICARQKPTTYDGTTNLRIPSDIIEAFVIYDFVSNAGTNPNDITKWQVIADNLLMQYKREANAIPRELGPPSEIIPTTWQELR